MARYTEDDLQAAITAVQNGSSLYQAYKDWGVPKATLHDRIKGACPKGQYEAQVLQKLSIDQENHLAQWIIVQEALALPVNHSQIRLFANRILQASGSQQTVGQGWVRKFIRRHPIIKTKQGKTMDIERINRATLDIIKQWFKKLVLPMIKDILPQNRHNKS